MVLFGLEEQSVSDISFSEMHIFSHMGILLENSSDICFHDIRMDLKEGIPIEAKDSRRIIWDMVSVVSPLKNLPFLKLTNCQNIKVTNCFQDEKIPVYIEEDEKCDGIYIANNIFPSTLKLHSGKGKNIITRNNIMSE